jgi:T5SS/PEP-CTERM-associated repeat protein
MTAGNLIVTNGTTKIADRASATFTQTGGNSAFADLGVGDLGVGTFNLSGGQLTVTPRTTNDLTIIGNLENGALNQSGGVVILHNELHIADIGGVTGDLNLSGGQLFATNDLVAIGRYGTGTITVSNALVVLTNTSVGRHPGASGTITLQDNASVFLIADLSIGRLAGSFGEVSINGGLLSITNDDLWVGRGGAGEMTVTAGTVRAKSLHIGQSDDGTNVPSGSLTLVGGMTQITSNLVVGTSQLSTGQVVMVGGDLIITNGSGSARLDLGPGSFALNGGNLTADSISIPATAGQFTFDGGTMRARSMTVSNGVPFVVGDGVNPATLELQGGTYSFADGLVIAANATVIGCGTIIGTISNSGTLNTNCGAVAPIITTLSKSANTATIWFSTLSGANHVLEFKQTLSDATWSPILPGITGNGGVTNKQDPTATNATRFYRIKVQ